jgi:hypothetical protein
MILTRQLKNSSNILKHIKIYEDFDLDKFMENPDEYFHDDSSKEVEEGDYVNSYRGTGRVLRIGPNFMEIQLLDGPSSIVKVPKDMVKKITKKEAIEISKSLPNTKKELDELANQMSSFIENVVEEDDQGKEVIRGNIESAVKYLEDVLIDVIALLNKDGYTTLYNEYSRLVSSVASLAHTIIESTEDSEIQSKIDKILDKFYELS